MLRLDRLFQQLREQPFKLWPPAQGAIAEFPDQRGLARALPRQFLLYGQRQDDLFFQHPFKDPGRATAGGHGGAEPGLAWKVGIAI